MSTRRLHVSIDMEHVERCERLLILRELSKVVMAHKRCDVKGRLASLFIADVACR